MKSNNCIVFLTTLLVAGVATNALSQSHPQLSIAVKSNSTTLSISADAGSPCTIQYTTLFHPSVWSALTNITMPAAPAIAVDSNAPGGRFYRAMIVVPANMVWVPATTFVMGSPTNEIQRGTNELSHTVTLTNGFFIGAYLVTQSNYLALTGTNPAWFTPANQFSANLQRPVETVSWYDASNYCSLLTAQERLAGRIFSNWVYRLPTEAEWERACRAGTKNAFYLGDSLLSGQANFDGRYAYLAGTGAQQTNFNSSGFFTNQTVAVGGYTPNALGLYDMIGNTWEWCMDWYTNYPAGSVTNPVGPATGTARVFRGGTLNSPGNDCRSAQRNSANPTIAVNTIGFRVVLTVGP